MKKLHILIIVIIAVISAVASFFLITSVFPYFETSKEMDEKVELTKEIALPLLLQEELLAPFAECAPDGRQIGADYDSCVIEITQEEDQWIVLVTYDGLFDDSIRASQIKTFVAHEAGQWAIKESVRTQKCQPNRGHQYFSTAFCI